MKFPPFSFTVIDTETTGLVPRVHTVVEFASVRIEGGSMIDEYTQLFSMMEDLPPTTQTLTRIRPEDLKGKPRFSDLHDEILQHIGTDTIIMGQNVGFDIAMIKGAGLDISSRPWIDTSMISSLVFPELDSYSLGYVSTILGLRHEPVHRALGDVHATLELITKCWERLESMPEELLAIARYIGGKSTESYRIFFGAIPTSKKKNIPAWLQIRNSKFEIRNSKQCSKFKIQKPQVGVIDLVEEPLEPGFLQGVVNACSEDPLTTHWIAVKNLEHTVRYLHIPEHARILLPPFLLPDTEIVREFAEQQTFAVDEATLAIKLSWYEPSERRDLPIHGNERFTWNGKIACTDQSERYRDQFTDLPHTLIIDHRQLLAFLNDPEHAAHHALNERTHIIIDDASSLEETATKAYGWSMNLDDLRAAVIADDPLNKFVDVLQLWIEHIRGAKDTYILTKNDLATPQLRGLKEQLDHISTCPSTPQLTNIFANLRTLFDLQRLQDNIVWIETRQNGSQVIHSVPECIDRILRTSLYEKFSTTLLIPPGSASHLREILTPNMQCHTHTVTKETFPLLSFAAPTIIPQTLLNPPPGKTIILMSSKHAIEQAFITYTESLESKDCTLFCQGFSGGQGRFQSEFGASKNCAILLITPWIFEGLELPPMSLDRLIIATLPFDSPVYPTIARRSLHYPDAFADYCLPRLEQRLFRIIKTFCQFSKKGSAVTMTDERMETKKYGKLIKEYLRSLVPSDAPKKDQMTLF